MSKQIKLEHVGGLFIKIGKDKNVNIQSKCHL